MRFIGEESSVDSFGEKYFILKFIFQEALKAQEKKEYGLALAIFEKLLVLINEPGYSEEDYQIHMIKKYYAYILASIGDFIKAINILQDLGIHSREIIRYYVELQDYDNALKEFELRSTTEPSKDYAYIGEKDLSVPLFFDKRYDDALKVLNRERSELSEQLCLLGLLCLNDKYDNYINETEIKTKYINLYNNIIKRYGNWESATINYHKKVTDKYEKFLSKIALKSIVETDINLEYNEKDVSLVFKKITGYVKAYKSLGKILININKKNIEGIREKVNELINNDYIDNPYLYDTILELYLLEENYSTALSYGKEKAIINAFTQQDLYYKLLHINNLKLIGKDIACYQYLVNHQTLFLAEHRDLFLAYCQDKLDEFEKINNIDLLNYIYNKYSNLCIQKWPFYLPEPNISNIESIKKKLNYIHFSSIDEFTRIITSMLDNAENIIRKLNNIPGINEGWVTESYIVNKLSLLFKPFQVIPQGSPPWLGRQRYDAYIPELHLAIEYQGLQHYKPVDYFGGEEGYIKTKKRDEYKKIISNINETTIEYIRYDEDVDKRIEEIVKKYKISN